MDTFLSILKSRNIPLYYFGSICLIASVICLVLMRFTQTKVLGINAWIKPFKFFLSSWIFVWTMGWILFYIQDTQKVSLYNWVVIVVLSFENIYIAIKAAKGQLSHFNISSPFNSIMFSLMGIAISIMTLWTGYIGVLFFTNSFPTLPPAYLLGLRLGIVFFVVFAFQGGVMGQKLAHTVGAIDGGTGLPLTNWSTQHGDLRIAHFIGMHALQIIPLCSYYITTNIWATAIFGLVYVVVTTYLFVQALRGKPLIKLIPN